MNKIRKLCGLQLYTLVTGRILMGWYFLYEGVVKLFNTNWTSYGFLKSAQGPFQDVFQNLAEHSALLSAVDFLNIWGLILIGLSLMLGLFSRWSFIAGMLLVLLYYFAHPPIIAAQQLVIDIDHAVWVDRNLIFVALLAILYAFPTSHIFGLDRLLNNKKMTINE